MSQITNLLDELKRSHNGEPWHGPSLHTVLNGITAEQAASRALPTAHSIWELVLHIGAWEKVMTQRLEGLATQEPDEGDFPPVTDTTEEAWTKTLVWLDSTHEELLNRVAKMNDADLEQIVVGKDYTAGFMLHGVVNHSTYHAGQISLLKKAFE